MLCVAGKSGGGQLAALAAGGGSAISVSVVWADYEPTTWTLGITDKDDVVQALSNSTPTKNVEFTQDGSTWHAYAFEFTQDGFDVLNGAITVNGSNTINSEYNSDTSEGGDPGSTAGTGITIDSGASSLVLTIDITQPI